MTLLSERPHDLQIKSTVIIHHKDVYVYSSKVQTLRTLPGTEQSTLYYDHRSVDDAKARCKRPCWWPVNTGVIMDIRVHGPCWRAVNSGSVCSKYPCPRVLSAQSTVVNTSRVHGWSKDSFVHPWTRVHGCSVHTTRVHGPWSRVVWTAPVNTARAHE